jgi:hypothetical protein
MDTAMAILGGVMGFMAALVVFLLLRHFMLWYWRVNEALEALLAIRAGVDTLVKEKANRRGDDQPEIWK